LSTASAQLPLCRGSIVTSSMYEALSPSLSFVMTLEGLLFVWNCLHVKMTSQPSSPLNLFTVAHNFAFLLRDSRHPFLGGARQKDTLLQCRLQAVLQKKKSILLQRLGKNGNQLFAGMELLPHERLANSINLFERILSK
jgi:hypothetical protein